MPATFTRTPVETERKDPGFGGKPPVARRPTGGGGDGENWDNRQPGRRGPRDLLSRYRMVLFFALASDLMFFIALVSAFFARQSSGHFSENAWVAFDDAIPLGSHIALQDAGSSGKRVEVVRLDDAVDDGVTYIKMDIEGAELNALAGCQETIRTNRPKLAICVYHRPSDYFEIPRLIHLMRPDYRLYLRQHSPFNIDTVLYAV